MAIRLELKGNQISGYDQTSTIVGVKPIVEVFLNVKTDRDIPRKLLGLSTLEAIKIL